MYSLSRQIFILSLTIITISSHQVLHAEDNQEETRTIELDELEQLIDGLTPEENQRVTEALAKKVEDAEKSWRITKLLRRCASVIAVYCDHSSRYLLARCEQVKRRFYSR